MVPSGEKATDQTIAACPTSVWRRRRMVHVGDVPDPHRPVPAPRGQGPAIARERDGPDLGRVSRELGEIPAGGHVQERHGRAAPPRRGSGRRARTPAIMSRVGSKSGSVGSGRPVSASQSFRVSALPKTTGRQDRPLGREGHGG